VPGQGEGAPGGEGESVTQRGGSLGSGFIISADGYVVTNNHVVAPARNNAVVESITVTLADRSEYEARVVGRDEDSDLAVLKIEPRGALPFVRFASSDEVRVGDWVVAIGNPYSLGGSVTAGIVSALHRNLPGGGVYDRYIQTDASINSGNSGGPLFDLQGNVVGINTALYSPTGGNIGIGFAIPAEQARSIVDSLRRGERVRRGYIGVSLERIESEAAEALGLERNRGELINSVTRGGPAERAGIQEGDVVVTVAGKPVTPDASLAFLISQQQIGSRVPMEVVRQGQRRTVQVQIAERPSVQELARLNGIEPEGATPEGNPVVPPTQSAGQTLVRTRLGVTVQTLTADLARRGNLTGDIRGVVVTDIDPNSDAGQKGLRPGHVILAVNTRPVNSPEQVASILAATRQNNVLLLVRTGNTPPRSVPVTLKR
jgi:serine protease Do